ncbi:MAG: acetyl/propionyl/methylcrotonyl-CoA carboxylase subunit alpha [Hyphomonadaceae bacterium]|nr:acetyl/propionyl/methylcrotonyl-CoA carboxylase subunit alpha [Hyphomonadaceae bacterium]
MFDKILIANRGEIAVRIIKTARRMGIKTALVVSEADRDSLAADMADETILIGPAPAAQSYLLADKIVAAVRQSGAQAVHPGFGFLSENAEFADRLAREKIVFIGPNVGAIRAMGDKLESKRAAAEAGVSTVPGFMGEIDGVKHAVAVAEEIGYPVMIKASAGGGGKGIRVAENRKEVEEGFPAVKAEAKASFGDDRILIEKFVRAPRHIEIQVMGDKHGHVVHLNERECSIQRRNQKVIEEAPSSLLDAETRAKMGAQAVALSKAVGYDSAGTVEFVASGADKSFYFLEMNTRLQVEHPVTEMITGLDLVELMIRVANGEKLPITQKEVKINGWAVESRIYAEDPQRNFLPSIGRLKTYRPPAEGPDGDATVRNDSGVREGDEISIYYDPMIAKLVTHAPNRLAALDAQARALDGFLIDGLQHNVGFLGAMMQEPDFRSGDFTTAFIKQHFPDGFKGATPTPDDTELLIAAAAFAHAFGADRARRISGRMADIRNGAASEWVVSLGGAHAPTRVTLTEEGALVAIDKGAAKPLAADWRPGQPLMRGSYAGAPFVLKIKPTGEGFTLQRRGVAARALVASARGAELHRRLPEKQPADTSKLIVSPMPGLVVTIETAVGREVKTGEGVAIVEAMKMQNIIRAERDGIVSKVLVAAGASVMADEVLVELA